MSLTPKGMSIQEAYRLFREGNLIVNRQYQRKLVWTTEEKIKLIDSIMRGYPIPLILLAERPEIHGYGCYEILDGVQRLTAIFDFIENRINWERNFFDTEEFTRAKALAKEGIFTAVERDGVNLLEPRDCAKFLDYQLAVTIYPAMKENDMIDVFGRINSQGRQLSPQERRQAGVINKFSDLVRKISFEIRGDVSDDILKLYQMPSISIDDYRADMSYSIKADEIFWCKTGILGKNELKNGEDEEMIADILASTILEEPFAKSRENLNKLYESDSEIYIELEEKFSRLDIEELYKNVVYTISVLREIIETIDTTPHSFRKRVSNQTRNPVKYHFYALYMAVYSLLVEEEMSPDNYEGIMNSIKNLGDRLTSSANYAKKEDRIQNIDLTKGLINKYFVRREPTALKHGPGLAIDLENSLRRSRIETARYEFKQGIFRLTPDREIDENLIEKVLKTITAIANTAQGEDGYLFIGIADKAKDAERIKELYGTEFVEKYDKYIVGIDREVQFQKWDMDQYIKIFIERIKKSNIGVPLKTQLLTQFDVVSYRSYSVIRIRIPKQESITLYDNKVFVRHNNDTIEVTDLNEVLHLQSSFKTLKEHTLA